MPQSSCNKPIDITEIDTDKTVIEIMSEADEIAEQENLNSPKFSEIMYSFIARIKDPAILKIIEATTLVWPSFQRGAALLVLGAESSAALLRSLGC